MLKMKDENHWAAYGWDFSLHVCPWRLGEEAEWNQKEKGQFVV